MPWVRLDADMLRSPAVAALTDDAFRAYVTIAAAGSETSPPGEWASHAHLAACVPGRVMDRVDDLERAGLLSREGPTYRVVERGFYPGESDAAARMRRRRAEPFANGSRTVHEPLTRASSSSSSSSSTPNAATPPSVPPPDADTWHRVATLAETLTGRAFVLPDPTTRLGERMVRMLAKHGLDAVTDAMTRAATAAGMYPEIGQVVLGAGNILDAVPLVPRAPADCSTCLNTGLTAGGKRCPDCRRGRTDA
jgi:hypothetical protein